MFAKKKRNAALLVSGVIVIIVALLSVGSAGAVEEVIINEHINKAAGSLEIPGNTQVNGDVTLNLGELTVLGVINGNVSSNMGQVNIIGDVNGDVEANMGQIVISGNVGGDVRARMGEVIVDGSVGGDILADLGAVSVSGTIGGNIDSGFGELLINGAVAGDVKSKGGNIVITGIVEGDVILEQGLVELGPQAVVSGRIYVGRGMVKKAETAIAGSLEIGEELSVTELQEGESGKGYRFDGVDGDFPSGLVEMVINSVETAFRDVETIPHMFRTRNWPYTPLPFWGVYGNAARGMINILIMFALTALTFTLFPGHVRAAGNAVSTKIGPVIGWGLLASFLAIPLMVLLAITIIGIPLIIIEIIVLAAAVILGYAGIANMVGDRIIAVASAKKANPLGAIAVGVLVIGLIRMIPFLGLLVSLVVYIFAIGAALVTRFGVNQPVLAETIVPADVENS